MKRLIIATLCSTLFAFGAEPLVFGAITTVKPTLVEQRFQPLFHYLEQRIGRSIVFATAPTYDRTIQSFTNGSYDLGWIGPSPYIIAMQQAPDSLMLLAALENREGSHFHGVIVTRKDAPYETLDDLKHTKFAFGSPNSTLSYYVPKYLLCKAGVYDTLRMTQFLGRHDKVLKQVIMGKAEAGGVKASEAARYSDFVKVIAESEAIPDFAVVCRQDLDPELRKRIQRALMELKDPEILRSIKEEAVGFTSVTPDAYNGLNEIMQTVQNVE